MLKKELEEELNRTKLILDYAREEIKVKDEKIEKLNKIINELEKGIKENIEELEEHQLSRDRIDEDKEILRFLQELKGVDKE